VESLKSVFGKASDYLTDLLKILENVHFKKVHEYNYQLDVF